MYTYEENAVTVLDYKKIGACIVGYVPFCHLLMFKKCLSLTNHSKRVFVKGKLINCGAKYGIEIPAEYIF